MNKSSLLGIAGGIIFFASTLLYWYSMPFLLPEYFTVGRSSLDAYIYLINAMIFSCGIIPLSLSICCFAYAIRNWKNN